MFMKNDIRSDEFDEFSEYDNYNDEEEKSSEMKKKKRAKADVVYERGDSVIYKNKKCKILYGPYEKNYKDVYELLTEDNTIVSAIATSIKAE